MEILISKLSPQGKNEPPQGKLFVSIVDLEMGVCVHLTRGVLLWEAKNVEFQ